MEFFRNSGLKAKLLILTLSLSLFSVAAGVVGIYFLKSTASTYEFILAKPVPKLARAKDMLAAYRRLRINVTILAIPGLSTEYSNNTIKTANEAIDKFNEASSIYMSMGYIPGQKELHTKLDESWKKYHSKALEIISLFKSDKPGDREAMTKMILNESDELAAEFTKNYEILATFHEGIAKKSEANAKNAADKGIVIAVVIAVSSFIFALIIGLLFSNYITRTLQEIATELSSSGDQVSSASSQIAAASEELSQATTEQAASLQETSSSIEEISSMISANTENAKQSSAVSEQSLNTAEKGKIVVDQMIKAIGDINVSNTGIMNQIDETNREIENIVKIINEIGNKTKVINDIVFQTKLLSFNASVEAARAGEQGKGFAVVAEEVGNLASMSGAAALEITNMLDESIKTVEGIVKDSKEKIGKLIFNGKEKVETGTRVAHECENVLNEIVSSVASVSKMVTEISLASQEQTQGVHEISKAIDQLDQVTQQNTANSAESANAAGTLSSQAEMLNSLVQKLALTIQGGDGMMQVRVSSKNSYKAKNNFIHSPSNEDERFADV